MPRKSIRTLHCTPSRRRPVHAQYSSLHSPGASPRRRGGAPSTGPGDLASRFPRDTAPTPATPSLAKVRTEVSAKGSTELSFLNLLFLHGKILIHWNRLTLKGKAEKAVAVNVTRPAGPSGSPGSYATRRASWGPEGGRNSCRRPERRHIRVLGGRVAV